MSRMFGSIQAGLVVLQKGQMLSNPATWKSRTVVLNTVAAIMTAGVAGAKALGYDIPLSDEELNQLALGVIVVLGMFNSWTTTATTDKIGIPPVLNTRETSAESTGTGEDSKGSDPSEWLGGN